MAVTTTANVNISPLGQDDQRLPIGFWFGTANSDGDLTGGGHTVQMGLTKAAPELLVSLEGLGVRISTAVPTNHVRFSLTTQELYGGAGFQFDWGAQLVRCGDAVFCPLQTDLYPVRYIANPINGIWRIAATIDNVNTANMLFTAWGYIWGVIARQLAGGPRRPI